MYNSITKATGKNWITEECNDETKKNIINKETLSLLLQGNGKKMKIIHT